MEPTAKRPKFQNSSKVRIEAILDELYKECPLENVYISKIENKQKISIIMEELSKLLPLPPLQHLKRVRKNEIIVCREQDLQNTEQLQEFLQRLQLTPAVVELLSADIQKIQVPATATKLRWQYEAMQRYWPCKFHPDNYLESLYNGSNFREDQQNFHSIMAKLVWKLSNEMEGGRPFGICVDARSGSVVALAASNIVQSPVMHCPMVLIDFVARTQNAGAWNEKYNENKFDFLEDPNNAPSEQKTEVVSLAGIPRRYIEFVNSNLDCHNLKFGAERLKSNANKRTEESLEGIDNLSKYGPYLCTGYDVYLSQEPCLMCSMALVHSRVKRVFFVRRSENGSLISSFKLHAVKELNHHYEVFRCHDPEVEKERKDIDNESVEMAPNGI